jgi:hypothetical protein
MVTMVERRARSAPKKAVAQPISVASAAESDDTLAALKALRDRLARDLDNCRSGRDVAALSARLTAVLVEIETWRPPRTSIRDEIAAKRAKRRAAVAAESGASIPLRSPRRSQSRHEPATEEAD